MNYKDKKFVYGMQKIKVAGLGVTRPEKSLHFLYI